MSKYTEMGKNDLRAACRTAGISYGKLNNDGMRAALESYEAGLAAPVVNTVIEQTAAAVAPVTSAPKTTVELLNASEAAAPAAKATKTGLKIEKDRVEQNGVKRPSVGGMCRAVWDALDAIGTEATAKQVKELAGVHGWNVNNASIEFYQWRKFNGIKGRTKAAK